MDGSLLLKFGWILLLKCKLFEVMKLALFELRGIIFFTCNKSSFELKCPLS